ncbi:MAG TPA: DNA mismatch repair endonuclease MutL [Phycisphaerae bacterium]|nr:DNA mismatch repair endonuclease MutL [Phycisphaerales bacterium]HRX86006.1 DNA mismatch repair endonuclease MutL [Phycisphaerae bacterium]
MSRIKILPDLLVNKIAAGEVIERPASVVKELVENAIDAGATHVTLHIEDGGRQLIRVSDDGLGMTAEELRLAVTPHATSKITTEDDLFHIATLGFRGEALASIGAVSHLRIVSRPRDAIEGAEIVVAAERVESASAAGCSTGTTVEVRDLFFNVPARRKFLKATATEVGHINEQMARIALAYRDVGFEVTNNQRTTLRLTGGTDIRERIAALFSGELGDDLIRIERHERGLHIEGYAAPPARSRATPAGQYILLNGRYIRDRFVQHAVREAYRGLMDSSRHPIVFLFLTIDPAQVDVNVHPTKIEVRWQDSNLVHSQVLSALRDVFLRTDLTPALRAESDVLAGGRARSESPDAESIRRDAAEFFKTMTPVVPGSDGRVTDPVIPPTRRPADVGPEVWDALYRQHEAQSPGDAAGSTRGGLDAPRWQPDGATAPPPGGGGLEARRRALQVHNTYLVVETDEGMVIIDQHALHERIMYDALRRQFTDGPLESQRLLLPETLTATQRELALLCDHADLLHRLGIEAEPFGRDTIAIQAFPSILKDTDAAAFLRDLLDRLAEKGEQTHTEEVIHDVLDMMSCKAAVKAGDPLTPEEIDALVAQKDLVEKSSNCPHGRPTTLRLTIRDLEKQFKRR